MNEYMDMNMKVLLWDYEYMYKELHQDMAKNKCMIDHLDFG